MLELIFVALIFAEFIFKNLPLVHKSTFCKVLLFVVIRKDKFCRNIVELPMGKMNSSKFPGNLKKS